MLRRIREIGVAETERAALKAAQFVLNGFCRVRLSGLALWLGRFG